MVMNGPLYFIQVFWSQDFIEKFDENFLRSSINQISIDFTPLENLFL